MKRITLHLCVTQRLLVLLALSVVFSGTALAENCEPLRNCDATRDCSLQVDTRDCEPHWGCDCQWYDHRCSKLLCEADKARFKSQCEIGKAAQNAGYAIARATCETQKSAEKLDCERIKAKERVACEAGLAGPWRCSAQEVMLQVRTQKQKKLTDFEEFSAYIVTPWIKNPLGQLAWRDTACVGYGVGIPYINSQNSTDGFCTIDVELISFVIDGLQKPPGPRYIRLEVLLGGKASQLCRSRTISTLDLIRFSGPIRRDWHPSERWLEVHLTDDLQILPKDAPIPPPNPNVPSAGEPQVTSYTVKKGDSLSRVAQATYGGQYWRRVYLANRARIRNPDLIFPGQLLILPPLFEVTLVKAHGGNGVPK